MLVFVRKRWFDAGLVMLATRCDQEGRSCAKRGSGLFSGLNEMMSVSTELWKNFDATRSELAMEDAMSFVW